MKDKAVVLKTMLKRCFNCKLQLLHFHHHVFELCNNDSYNLCIFSLQLKLNCEIFTMLLKIYPASRGLSLKVGLIDPIPSIPE